MTSTATTRASRHPKSSPGLQCRARCRSATGNQAIWWCPATYGYGFPVARPVRPVRLPDQLFNSVRLSRWRIASFGPKTPSGPVWHRYTGDGYGEHEDGAANDGTGIGRRWPLLVGERGDHQLAAGRDARPYLAAMRAMGSSGGMLPEQVWDAPAIPGLGLWPGRPSGSAMPLAWAHAEYLKLARSIAGGSVVDRPERVWERYHGEAPLATRALWRFDAARPNMPAGRQRESSFSLRPGSITRRTVARVGPMSTP